MYLVASAEGRGLREVNPRVSVAIRWIRDQNYCKNLAANLFLAKHAKECAKSAKILLQH